MNSVCWFKWFITLALIQGILSQSSTPLPINNSLFIPNFNQLQYGKEGTKFPFTQGTTVPGLWSNQGQYIASAGSTNEASLYSFGESGSSVRSVGAITSNSKKLVNFGFSLVADQAISSMQVSIMGQQWRFVNDSTQSTLRFDYYVSTMQEYNNGAWGVSGDIAGWIVNQALSLASLVNSNSGIPVGPVFNVTQPLSSIINVNVPAGDVLQFRWTAHNSRDGLAINNLQISFTFVPATTPNPLPLPTSPPTNSPTNGPTDGPTNSPSPTEGPTIGPTISPSPSPTIGPSPSSSPRPRELKSSGGFGYWKYVGPAIGALVVIISISAFFAIKRYRRGYQNIPMREPNNSPRMGGSHPYINVSPSPKRD